MHTMTYNNSDGTYLWVYCNGFALRICKDDTSTELIHLFNEAGSVEYGAFSTDRVSVVATTYKFKNDLGRVTTVSGNDSRVKVTISGNMEDNSQSTLSNSTSYTLTLYIYPDRFISNISWVVGGSIVLYNSAGNNRIAGININNATSPTCVYENTTEDNASDATDYNSASYLGVTSTEIDGIMINMALSSGTGWRQRAIDVDYAYFIFGWNNTTLSADTYTATHMYIIDSAGRDGSAKLYTNTTRLEQGNQYKDYDLDT